MDAVSIMERLLKAQFRFTECSRIRSQVKQLEENERSDLHNTLRRLLNQPSYGDLGTYVSEIFSDYRALGKK